MTHLAAFFEMIAFFAQEQWVMIETVDPSFRHRRPLHPPPAARRRQNFRLQKDGPDGPTLNLLDRGAPLPRI